MHSSLRAVPRHHPFLVETRPMIRSANPFSVAIADAILWSSLLLLSCGLLIGICCEAETSLGVPNAVQGLAKELSEVLLLDQISPPGLQGGRGTMQLIFLIGGVTLLFPLYLNPGRDPGGEVDKFTRFLKTLQWFLAFSAGLAFLPFPIYAMLILRLSLSWGMFRWLKYQDLLPEFLRWRDLLNPKTFCLALAGKKGAFVSAFFGVEYLAIGYALQAYPLVGCLLVGLGGVHLTSFAIQGILAAKQAGKSTTILKG